MLGPYSVVELPEGNYQTELQIQQPIYLRGNGNVTLYGWGMADTVLCAGEFVVIENVTIAQVDTRCGGGICVCSGYTSLVGCRLTAPYLSSVLVCNDGSLDLFNCEAFGSHNPSLHVLGNGNVRLVNSTVHSSKTCGVLIAGDATAIFHGSSITQNAASGIIATENGSAQLVQSQISANGGSALDVSSPGFLLIEGCIIRDHEQGCGILAHGAAAVKVTQTQFPQCKFSAIRSMDGAVVTSVGCQFEDAPLSVLVCAENHGVIFSEGDIFQGDAVAAIAALSCGKVEAKSPTIQNLTGSGVIAYDGGKVAITGGTIAGVQKYGLQVRDDGVLELTEVSVAKAATALSVRANARGFVKGCKFLEATTAGEFSNVSTFEVVESQFCWSGDAGLICRGVVPIHFIKCQFNENRKIGADIAGSDCAPVFNQCRFQKNGSIGVKVSEQGSVTLSSGELKDSGKIGLFVVSGRAVAEGLDIGGCGEAAIGLFAKSTGLFKKLNIQENRKVGCQVKGSTARLIESSFSNHANATSIIVSDDGVVQCEGCKFDLALQAHCEVGRGAIAFLGKCEIGPTAQGIGVQVHDGGVLMLEETVIEKAAKFGVFVGGNGTCKGFKSTVRDCGKGGLYASHGSNSELEDCTFEKNGKVAVQVQGGDVLLLDSQISGHSAYGVFVESGAAFSEFGTTFQEDGHDGLFRA
jgi:hypothetical protein